jgi:indolepyruvate ferredoxin oxidoreductase alpha subunit
MIDYETLGKALGVKHIRKIDPYNIKETMQVVKEEMDRAEPSLILCTDSPCIMLKREKRKFPAPFYTISTDKCRGCKVCLEIGCPAISWQEGEGKTTDGHKRKGTVYINKDQCVGCEVCVQVCKFEAVQPGAK